MQDRFLQQYIDALSDLIVRLRIVSDGPVRIRGAASDSRQIHPGWMFCAVQGSQQDGHQFIGEALSAGASVIVLEKDVPVPEDVSVIQVKDGYRALGRVAECMYGYPASSYGNIGITGTNGKTTCAFLLRELLRRHHCSCGMIGTVEYDLGNGEVLAADRTTPTPFELQKYLRVMADHAVEYGIFEVSSHALAQGRLGGMKFRGGIFTNLTQDHLDYHGSMEEYYRCKRRLFLEMMENADSPVIVNGDDSWGQRLIGELPVPPAYVIRKGTAETIASAGECILIGAERTGGRTSFCLRFQDGEWNLVTGMAGEYNLYNLSSVICMARCLGMSYEEIAAVTEEAVGAPGRLQLCPSAEKYDIYVDYAHTDDAIVKVLQALRPLCRGRLSIVFGCGGNRDRTKRPKMGAAAAGLADRLYITSDNPRREAPGDIIADIMTGIPVNADFRIEEDRRKAIALAIREAAPGDVILIAGKGHENYQEIQGVRHPFSDFICVKEILKR